MKPMPSPKRTSSRIKAMANKSHAPATASSSSVADDTIDPAASPSDNTAPQAQAPTTTAAVSHGFQAPVALSATAAAIGGRQEQRQPASIGVPPKLSSRQKSTTTAAAKKGGPHPPPPPPPPYAAPPPYPGHPAYHAAFGAGHAAPQPSASLPSQHVPPPPPPYTVVDPKVMEERKRAALAYAMQDHVGGSRGSRSRAGAKSAAGRGSNAGGASTNATKKAASSRTASVPAASAASGTRVSNPTYPPASELISGVYALAAAASQRASSATANSDSATSSAGAASKAASTTTVAAKRKPGRPRKNAATAAGSISNATTAAAAAAAAATPAKRKVGRPRKVPHPDSPMAKRLAAEAAARAAKTSANGENETTAAANANDIGTIVSNNSSEAAKDLTSLSHTLQADTTNANVAAGSTIANPISQSLPSSNNSSDDDGKGTTVNSSQVIKSTAVAQSQQNAQEVEQSATPSPTNYNPLPLRSRDASSVYDDEYARFMRSIIGDDQSIITFKTLQSIKGGASVAGKDSVVGSAFETMDEDDVSYQLTSDEEEDDDDDDDDDDNDELEDMEMAEEGTADAAVQASPQKKSTTHQPLPPTTPMGDIQLPHDGTNDEDLLNVLGEIEGLMEEDLEAAVMASLIGGPSDNEHSNTAPSSWGCVSGMGGTAPHKIPRGPSNNTGAVMGTMQQKAITTPGVSTKKKKSTTTVVTTPSPCPGKDRQANNSQKALEVPAVSKEQLARLRTIMARHHQLLLQQATLSVRAAYVQKVRKDGVSAAASKFASVSSSMPSPVPSSRGAKGKGNSSLPESRLDTRSLTFCSRPADSSCSYVNDFFGGETPEELSECLDGAVGMLQDLEQNWKDAVRNSIQLPAAQPPPSQAHCGGRRNINFAETSSSSHQMTPSITNNASAVSDGSRRLTRSAFTKTLLEREMEMGSSSNDGDPSSPSKHPVSSTAQHPTSRVSVFDVRGLSRLKDTFSALDNSVKDIQMGREKGKNKDGINILAPDVHGKACEVLLKHAKAEIDTNYLPGGQPDLGSCLTHAPEAFDEPGKVGRPLTKKQEAELRRNRHTFTAGEDNLILRGVNLYGEKEWCLVSDRFLPDRVVNSISQRYNKLCFLIYKANGILIDDKGKLPPIPSFPKGASYDISKIARIKPAQAPTTMNVHRWTLEEDIAILKAVPVMGNLWAEICTRLMPHRDRGHIRKRFQVLQRRIPKGITKMNLSYLQRPAEPPKPSKPQRKPGRPRSSPTKKRVYKKKQPSAKVPLSRPPPASPAKIFQQAAARAAAMQPMSPARIFQPMPKEAASPAKIFQHQSYQEEEAASPARIFEQAAQVHKRPPMSPIKSALPPPQSPQKASAMPLSPPKPQSPPKTVRPFSNRGVRALSQALAAVESGNVGEPSPETREVASVLGGFSGNSRLDFQPSKEHEEDTQMGVEKILGNDEWSQESGMERLLRAGAAESNFVRQYHRDDEPSPARQSELPAYQVQDGEASGLSVINDTAEEPKRDRKSILSSVMEKTTQNARKRKNPTESPSTPTKHGSPRKEQVISAPEGYPSSVPTSSISFNLGTPAKGENMGSSKGELNMDPKIFEYFMSEKSRQATTPGRAGSTMSSPAKAAAMMMTPIKLANLAPTTPLSEFANTINTISGPLDGENSLLMQSDFDAVAALKDLSNSAPNTPSKLLRPRGPSPQDAGVPYHQDDGVNDDEEAGVDDECAAASSRKKPKTSLFGQVKAKVGEKRDR